MARYALTVDGIALAAATPKTIAEIGTASSSRATIIHVGVTFDGVVAANTPVLVELRRASAGVTTATTLAGDRQDLSTGTAASTTKHSTTVEGGGTLSGGEMYRVPPTSGLILQYPLGRELIVPVSAFWRIRCTAAQAVNVTFTLIWDE